MRLNDEEQNELINKGREVFREALSYTNTHWKDCERYQAAYRSQVDRDNWPTMSEIVFPEHFIAVEQSIPFLFEYLLPNEEFLELMPLREPLDYQTVRRAENYIEHLLRDVMNLRSEGIKTIKDAMIMGIGYGMVEYKYVTPPTRLRRSLVSEGALVSEDVTIGPAEEAQLTMSYSHIPVGQVIPVGNGADPDEGEHCVVRFRTEQELREMKAEDDARPPERQVFSGDIEDILEKSRSSYLDASVFPAAQIMARLAGGQVPGNVNSVNHQYKSPLVPVMELYLYNEHIWLANGTAVIYHQKSETQRLKSGLVRANPCPNSNNWFSPGIAAASESLSYGKNALNNAVFDLVNFYLNPVRVVDVTKLADATRVPSHEPYSTIEMRGDAREGIQYITPPPLPDGILGLSDKLTEEHGRVVGQPLQLQGQGSPGLVRGGLAAFESLLSTPMGREKLIGAILEMGWLEKIIDRVIPMSVALVDGDETFITREEPDHTQYPYVSSVGDVRFVQNEVTSDDLAHVYGFSLNLRAKMRQSSGDEMMKLQTYDRLKDRPTINQRALDDYFLGDKRLARRLSATPEEQQEAIAQQQAAQQPQQQPAPSQQEQGLNGILANA